VLGGVRDSKKTNRQQRVKLAAKIHESCVVGLGVATPAEIDDLGINQAEKLALSRAIAHIRAQGHEPTDVIGDLAMPAIVGVSTTREKSADDKHPEASAASIAAKYALDLYWERVNEHYPNYGFLAHAGYVQPPHLEAMNRFGWIPGIHRLSYKPCREKAAAPTLRQAQCNAAADQLNTQGEYRMVASISPEVVAVLENAAVEGNTIKLNSPQLDRKLYVKVNEILERIGGKWKGGKVSAHVFENDPTDLLQSVLDSGDLPDKNPLAFFGTPPDLATRVAKSFKPENVAKGVLEPSAGEGALALAVRDLYPDAQIDCVEIDSSRAKKLKTLGFNTIEGDFLQVDLGRKYGVIVMNPPFSVKGDNLAYLTHIEKAFSLLKEGGQLIAIAPNGLAFNNQKRVQEFRALVQEHGNWEELEEGAFKASGTGVSTALVSIKKPEPPVTVLKQTLDYSSFPSDESIQAKSEKAQLIRDQILAVDSEADYAELRTNPNLTREQLNWVRENLITKEERKALAQRIRANPLPKPVAVGDVVCDRQGEVIGIVTKAMVTFLEIGDTKLSWEDFETQGLTKQILDEQNQPEIAEPLAPTEIVATSDAEELSQIETEIEEIQKSAWAEIGQRLKRIREGKLYKAKGYSNWDTYCRDRWNYGKSYANDLINAVKAQEILTGTAVILDNPNQAVPIRKMVNAGIESNQIQELVQEIAGSGNLTAEIIEQAAQDKGLLPTAKPKKQPTPIVAAAIDNQLMANASESQCRQVIGLIDQDKDSKIQYLEALFIEKEQVVSDYWDEIIKVRNERDELAKRVKQLETELGKPSVAA
jgi:ribonuclease HII/predicted RNA methylase